MSEMIVTDPERRSAAIRALHRQNMNPGENLIDLADSVLLEVADIDLDDAYPEDRLSEIADSAVPVYTGDILDAASEDYGLLTTEPDIGPAFDGSPTPVNIAAANLYELAYAIATEALEARRND